MDPSDRDLINGLFDKLRQAETQSGPRDSEAEVLIREQLGRQPSAPYYMAQAIVMQEQALAAQHAQIQELQRQLAERPSGGFLSSLFGGGSRSHAPAPVPPAGYRPMPGYAMPAGPAPMSGPGYGYANGYGPGYGPGAAHGHHGGGFMAGALQTAMAVAGGVLIGSALADMLSPEEAVAGALPGAEPEAAAEEPVLEEELF